MSGENIDPFSPDFWRRYAAERRQRFANRKVATAGKWDGLADQYHKFEQDEDFVAEKKWIIDHLRQRGILTPERTVADIACGPGTHCLDLARYCRRVVAVDVSPKMIARLREKLARESLANLEVVQADFFAYRSSETFDLVFVSMSPILNELATIDRLLQLSSRYLALIYWAGVRENPLYNHCYEMIFHQPYVWDPLDITAIFNYLYSLGLTPEISYRHAVWKRRDTVAGVIAHTIWHLEFYRPLSGEEKAMVSDYLRPLADGEGMISYETRVRKGFLILDQEAGREK